MTLRSAPRSRRAPADGKRDHRVAVRFSAEEMARVDAAAARDRMVASAWAGEIILAAADPDGPLTAGRALREEKDAVLHATEVVRKVGYLLNQAVAAFHATGTPPEELTRITALTWRVVTRLDDEVHALRAARDKR